MRSFDNKFCRDLTTLMKWRRDVRHFRTDPVDEALLMQCLDAFSLAPSVGLSEPWRLVRLSSSGARTAALTNFQTANADALAGFSGERAALYSRLKLTGMQHAPVQIAVFCDDSTTRGNGLGANSMPETRRYSVVGAINLFWLTARAHGLGVGWVSILDPDALKTILDVPPDWSLVAYLCIGWPQKDSQTPELETLGWETRRVTLSMSER